MGTAKKILLATLILLVTGAGTAYFCGMAYFQTHYLAGTTINGFDCSLQTPEEAEALLVRKGESYAIEIDTRNNGIEKIAASDAGLEFDGHAELEETLKNQNYRLWFLPVGEEISLSANAYKIDESKLTEACMGLACMQDMVQAQAACVTETDGFWQVSPYIRGTELDTEKVIDSVGTALRQWRESISLEDAGCYIDVESTDEAELQDNCDLLNSIRDIIITYDFGDRKETVDFDTVKTCFIDADGALDMENIQAYLQEMADTYDTVGALREFVTYDDRAVSIQGGDYGWKMNVSASAEELLELITAQTVDVVDPVYSHTAVSRDANDIGRSYLEIDTENGTAVLYEDGSPVIQANVWTGDGVSQGFFSVKDKDNGQIILENGSIYARTGNITGSFSGNGDLAAVSPSAASRGCIAVEENAMAEIFTSMDESWPVVIY